MNIKPEHVPVGKIFHDSLIFDVPKYQRGYAWGDSEIADFLDDFQKAYERRQQGNPIKHFFGGIVSVEKDVEGAAHQRKYEIVDGQQRIATFIILMSRITRIYSEILDEAKANNDEENAKLIEKRTENLEREYFEVEIEINRNIRKFKRLELSRADDDEFRNLLRNREISITRDSHKRLKSAFKEIEGKIRELLKDSETISDKLDVLENIKLLIDEDFSIIHIVTKDKQVAYKLFQVLNNRGISLTEGDLLRAKTLELLDPDQFSSHQDTIERAWDDILKDPPSDTEKFLRWIYASHNGKRPGRSSLFEDFLDAFYTEHKQEELQEVHAESIVKTTLMLKKEFGRCRRIIKGDWPFEVGTDITEWDINRLEILISELKHVNSIPLLLAACELSQSKFLELVNLTEKIYFRYKLVCNEHEGSLKNMYQREAVKVRSDTEKYEVSSYESEVKKLQDKKAGKDKFSNLLDDFVYQTSGGNKKIRYFLITAEYCWRWFKDGANGKPKFNKDIVHLFSSTTLEHIYPQNADKDQIDEELEKNKHKLGNLTILAPKDNKIADNATFDEKKKIFEDSKLLINKRVCGFDEWNIKSLQQREKEFKNLALKVYTI